MSEIRLVMLEKDAAISATVPSSSIASVLYSIGKGATDIPSFWKIVGSIDLGLEKYFQENLDSTPILEGHGDGLLVVRWHHCCIESFQDYQPVRAEGYARLHTGVFTSVEEETPFCIGGEWHLIDHHFEESRH